MLRPRDFKERNGRTDGQVGPSYGDPMKHLKTKRRKEEGKRNTNQERQSSIDRTEENRTIAGKFENNHAILSDYYSQFQRNPSQRFLIGSYLELKLYKRRWIK